MREFESLKVAGNLAFQSGRYQEAYNLYTEALHILGLPPLLSPRTDLPLSPFPASYFSGVAPEHRAPCSVLLCNRSAALLGLGDLYGSLEDSLSSLRLDSGWQKAGLRRDEALRRLGVELGAGADSVVIGDTGGMGRGWYAVVARGAGEVVIREPAVVAVAEGGLQELFMAACRRIMTGGQEIIFDAVCRVGRGLGGGSAEGRTELIASTLRDNSHTIFVESCGRSVASGVGFFPLSSMFNHSCRPNCVWMYDGKGEKLVHRTVRDVSPGEQLTVPYTASAGVSPFERIADLAQRRGFACSCSRCSDPEERDDALAVAMRCPGGHLVLPVKGTARSRNPMFPLCPTCGSEVPAACLAECQSASGAVVTLTRAKNHRSSCERGAEAILQMERWLGPRHHLWHTFLAALTASQADQRDRPGLRASARALDAQQEAWRVDSGTDVSDDLDLFSAVVPMLRVVGGWTDLEGRRKRVTAALELFKQRRGGTAEDFLDLMIPEAAEDERGEFEKLLHPK